MAKRKVHFRNIRMRNNGGIDFPECQTNAALLDLDKTAWATSGNINEVTCKKCQQKTRNAWWR